MATTLCAKTEEAYSAVCKAQGNPPTVHQLAGRNRDWEDQSDTARLGELFPGWAFESLFHTGQRMGREKSQASFDAGPGTKRLGLEAVE